MPMPQGGRTRRAPEMPLAFHVDTCRLWPADEFSPVRIGFSDVAWDVLHPGPGDRAVVVEVEAVIDDSPRVRVDLDEISLRDAVGAVAAIRRQGFLGLLLEALLVSLACEEPARPVVLNRELGPPFARSAFDEVRQWVVAVNGDSAAFEHVDGRLRLRG